MLLVITVEVNPIQQELIRFFANKMNARIVEITNNGFELVNNFLKSQADILLVEIDLTKPNNNNDVLISIKERVLQSQIVITISSSKAPKYYIEASDSIVTDFIQNQDSIQYSINQEGYIYFKQKNRECHLRADNILYIEKISSKKCKIVCKNQKEFLSSSTLTELVEQSPKLLFRAHKSFLVNINNIQAILPDLLINGNYEIKISKFRGLHTTFKKKL